MTLPLYVALEKIDRRLLEAADDLYAGPCGDVPPGHPAARACRASSPARCSTFIPADGRLHQRRAARQPAPLMIGNVIQRPAARPTRLPARLGPVVHPDGGDPRSRSWSTPALLGTEELRLMATRPSRRSTATDGSGAAPSCADPTWLLPIYVLGVTLYLILPIVGHDRVQLQRPGRQVQPAMARVLDRRAGSIRSDGPACRRRSATASSSRSCRRSSRRSSGRSSGSPWSATRSAVGAAPTCSSSCPCRRRRSSSAPAADDLSSRRPAAVHPGRAVVYPTQHPHHHPDRPHHVQHQLRGRHREGPAVGLPDAISRKRRWTSARTSGRPSGR